MRPGRMRIRPRGRGSPHLRSRHEVGDIFADRLPTVELRASLVLGQGGASYELLRALFMSAGGDAVVQDDQRLELDGHRPATVPQTLERLAR